MCGGIKIHIDESSNIGPSGATVARLTPDQKVVCSNHTLVIVFAKELQYNSLLHFICKEDKRKFYSAAEAAERQRVALRTRRSPVRIQL